MTETDDGNLGARVLAGVIVSLVAERLGPGMQVVAAGALPLAEGFVKNVLAEWRRDGADRTSEMLNEACRRASMEPEELADLAGATAENRQLTANAMAGAFNTAWPPKVRALGRILAAGLIATDEAEIDIRQLALSAMADMERIHISLLDLLVRYEPGRTIVDVGEALPYHKPSYPGVPSLPDPPGWMVGHRVWTASQICHQRPQLRRALTSLVGTLERHGLALLNDSAPEALKRLGRDLAEQINTQAGQVQRGRQTAPPTLRAPADIEVEPNWSPTELGEQVLAFYDEAAAEGD